MISLLAKTTRRFRRRESGSTAVEFALVAAPFIALLLACLQTGLAYLSSQALELAAEKAARVILTGQAQQQGMSQATFLSTVCSKLPSLLKCANTMVDVQKFASFSAATTAAPTITYNASGSVSNGWNYVPGGPGDIVVMRVMYLLPVIGGPLNFVMANAGNGKHLLIATAVFKVEPYQ